MLDLEIPTETNLRYNKLGGAIVRQSDLSSWSRCALQKFYNVRAENDPEAVQPKALSATVYGTVMHYALMGMEKGHHAGEDKVLERAQATFDHYWHPDNVEQLEGGLRVNEWLPRQTWGGLRERGHVTLRTYYETVLLESADKLIGLEYQFAVPLTVNGRTHTLTGTIDRLSIARHYRKPYLLISDFKTGKQPTYLRYNVQGTSYSYASAQPEFWLGTNADLWDGHDLETFGDTWLEAHEEFFQSWGFSFLPGASEHRMASRRFRWINMAEVKFADGGWRNERDFTRLAIAVDAYVRANEAGVYSPTTTGEICRYCEFRKNCGGPGLPEETEGAP
jgi:hypothetical protein